MKTWAVQAEIPPEREISIKVPDDVPLGLAEIVVVIAPAEAALEPAGLSADLPARGAQAGAQAGTAGDLVRSPLFGLWSDRDDIDDSVEYARRLRAQAEQRGHG